MRSIFSTAMGAVVVQAMAMSTSTDRVDYEEPAPTRRREFIPTGPNGSRIYPHSSKRQQARYARQIAARQIFNAA